MLPYPEKLAAHLELKPPQLLWHYTSVEAFANIIREQQLWLSDLQYLNDSSEFSYTKHLAFEQHAALAARRPGYPPTNFLDFGLAMRTIQFALTDGPLADETTFLLVASFSEARDNLSQWRAYGGSSLAVSIGFDMASLSIDDANSANVFGKCIYDRKKQLALLQESVDPLVSLAEKHYNPSDVVGEEWAHMKPSLARIVASVPGFRNFSHLADTVLEVLTRNLMKVVPLLKHPAFSAESEWRWSYALHRKHIKHPAIRFRTVSRALIPFLARQFMSNGVSPIKEIILGPGADKASIRAVRLLLEQHDMHAEISVSEVPYRSGHR